MFGFLKNIVRTKVVDMEAKLFPAEGCTWGGQGEIELEIFSDGQGKIEFELEYSSVPPGSIVTVFVAGTHVGEFVTSPGQKSKEVVWLNNSIPAIPQVQIGDPAEMQIDGQICYVGQFRRD
jgi:hypothetical protein